MSITNLSEVKDILGISDTDASKDSVINALIGPAEEFVFAYTNNLFELFRTEYYLECDTLTFDKESRTITDSDSNFVDSGFKDGVPIRVQNSFLNDGIYRVKEVTANIITLEDDQEIEDEDPTDSHYILLTMMKLPKDVKMFVARFIEYSMTNDKRSDGISSESFSGYSVSYIQETDVPKDLLALLQPYRCLR